MRGPWRLLLPTLLMTLLACRETHAPPPAAATEAGPQEGPRLAPAEPSADREPFAPEKVTGEAGAMGTHLLYVAYTNPRVGAAVVRQAFDDATAEIRRIERLMTTWRPDSEVSRINAAAGKSSVAVSDETFAVVALGQKTSERSGGAFDLTFETLHGLWKFDEDLDPHPPTDAQIAARLKYVGYGHVHLDPAAKTVALDTTETRLGLGGIAKGYAVDKAAAILDKAGVDSFFVQAGGDLFTRGRKPDGSAWSAGIRDPRGPEGAYFAKLSVSDHAFSTAGDYERSYVVGGVRYHHILDPHTGRPANKTRSVTLWAESAFLADALDDAVFVLGPEKGLELVDATEGVGAVIVDAKNRVWISNRLRGEVQLLRPPTDAL